MRWAELPQWATPYVVEGRADDRFAALCNGAQNDRAWVLACLSLARVETLDSCARRVLYGQIALRRRREVLAELSGLPVPAAAVRALGRVQPADLERDDWVALIGLLSRPNDAQALSHVPHLTSALVRQYDSIPIEIRMPRLLTATSGVRIANERWRRLGETLALLPAAAHASAIRQARSIDGSGALWDFFFRCRRAAEERLPFPVDFPQLGPLLLALTTAKDMRREGRRMENCLAGRISRVLDGHAMYYRWIGAEEADVELLRGRGGGWATGMMAGRGNVPLSPPTRQSILNYVHRAAASQSLVLANVAADVDPRSPPGISRAEQIAGSVFTRDETERVAAMLRKIRGRSRAADDGAYCILEMNSGPYIQFLGRTDQPWFWTEISSHHFKPALADNLTEEAVVFLEECHFSWPVGMQNFGLSVAARSDEDCARAAAFALGSLHVMFGYQSAAELKITIRVPGE